MTKKSVVVTGASGLLGRAVVSHFQAQGDEVIKLANSRAKKDASYTKLDLMDKEAVNGFFQTHPIIDVVVHCAAERRPDVAEADPEKAAQINAEVPAHLSALANQRKFLLIYISTDYVFNGKNPPYEVDAQPDPLQMYGRQKLDGEKAVLAEREKGAKVTVLRVPILYGKTEYNAESAVNILRDVVEDQSGKKYKMDAYQVRFPTNVEDVARVLFDLSHLDKPLPSILHYATPSPALTKYDMTQLIAQHLKLPIDHIIKDTNKPGPDATPRPENTQLSTKALKELGVDVGERKRFGDWWGDYIAEGK
ncbi:dTDP-4-dehydrorhamnose reductase [Kwoniella mangroviensis CBS 10435]|uniref:dTDP-4-dehydrorhamnose reductase n=1 Tax=Kwoniella mangroviensis CBS 10435 TaxID=1331196 RepID=A0A1B9IIW0_9TREE|nr:dTDP-4-dehydrorhamnose reductase [Kwoniella mangroviensis CBS 10435]OCF71943.1 dTDP-4-dehydrorhamnose reductase [Kwoniella mangroviensis CBS 8886]